MKIKREHYLKKIRPFYDADLIKVITGLRRAGKSVLLESIIDELVADGISGDHIIYINHEEMDFAFIVDASDLHSYVKKQIRDKSRYYLFFDEIQHVEDFEKALASFRATYDVSIFVTGSNSTLLSGELATLLTGRTIEFEILPFSFSEMKDYYELNNIPFDDDKFFDYLKWGGLPLRFQFFDEESVSEYIRNLYESIINRDIASKSSRIDKKAFKGISSYILANAGKEFSAESVMEYYNSHNDKDVSLRTIYNYIEKMKKAYLLHSVGKYNLSGKQALDSRDKLYAADMGFRTINTNTINYEDTFFLENIIYNELIVRGYTVFTGRTYKSEVDFVAIKDGKKCFIQVSYYLASEETIRREFGAFSPISDSSPKYVMSLDKIDMSRNGIAHVNIIDYLLHRVDITIT